MQAHRLSIALALLATALVTRAVCANPVAGFQETWSSCTTAGWQGLAGTNTRGMIPGRDGTGCCLYVQRENRGQFRARASSEAYQGDWIAAGIVGVRMRILGSLGLAYRIYFLIGNDANQWLYTQAFEEGSWTAHTVDLTSPAAFTQIVGTSGTFEEALRNATFIELRHDEAPFGLNASAVDDVYTDMRIDDLEMIGSATRSMSHTWGRIKNLYR